MGISSNTQNAKTISILLVSNNIPSFKQGLFAIHKIAEENLPETDMAPYDLILIDLEGCNRPTELPFLLGKIKNKPVCIGDKNNNPWPNASTNCFWYPEEINIASLSGIIAYALGKWAVLCQQESKLLTNKLDMQRIMMEELEQTNNNLISATWRERDMKKQLREALEENEKSRAIIEHQNFRIAESINYAKNIQEAINVHEKELQILFPESFIFYKPKDVISGDFPWIFKKGNYVYLAATDCTGHGVPGAMMSMLGNLLLNDIVKQLESPLPSQILDALHRAVVRTLKQDWAGSNSHDGMDIALLRIDTENKEVHFASAHRPLFYVSQNQFNKLSGDKYPIGGVQYDKKRGPFTNTIINYETGDTFYIFSDGLPDQLGGPEKKKFNVLQIAELIMAGHSHDMPTIAKDFEKAITEWVSTYRQIDDMLLIGLRL
jgi:serine phosphatase RsbU (regulator of sigma subunit)